MNWPGRNHRYLFPNGSLYRMWVCAKNASVWKILFPPEAQEWLQWAKRKADWYDPLIEGPDELLADVDLNTLEFPKRHIIRVGVKESSQILLKQLNWPSGQQKSVR